MCTDSAGNAGTNCSDSDTTTGASKHLANLNAKALSYCNSTYAYAGKCDSNSAWNMNNDDFQEMTGDTLITGFSKTRGYYDGDSIINNGSYYWYATTVNSSSAQTFYWLPQIQKLQRYTPIRTYGVRPVLRLKSSVIVTGGTGTYEDPYTISLDSTE